ncbi:MAG: amidohydrolase family protein [Acutalibacteraceae bacterium]|jgi:predicted TIM-barrel fold metal-dependent hydrolase
MLIDFHTHCFPDEIAHRAVEKLSIDSGGLQNYTDGTLNGLKDLMQKTNVDTAVVLNIATNPHQQKKVNDFAAFVNSLEGFIAFGSVHPDSPDALEELERIKELGLKGLKLHPDYQSFNADDPKLKPIYKKISELEFITVFHAGHDCGFPPPYGGTPEKLLGALKWLDCPVVAAHWGGAGCYEKVLETLCGNDLYFDTSFGYSSMPKYYALKIIEKHGIDKMLFGTDAPWHTAELEMRLIDSLNLTKDEAEKITCKNAEKLLTIFDK